MEKGNRKYIWSSLLVLCVPCSVFARQITFPQDTIFTDHILLGFLRRIPTRPISYVVSSLSHNDLIEVHNAYIEIDGKPAYIFTFLNNGKKAISPLAGQIPSAIAEQVISARLISDDTIDKKLEAEFIETHPLPDGYTDIDELVNY